MPTKIQNMGNLFPIKEKSWVITISFTANVRVRIWGYMGGASEQFVEGKRWRILQISYLNLKIGRLEVVFLSFVLHTMSGFIYE